MKTFFPTIFLFILFITGANAQSLKTVQNSYSIIENNSTLSKEFISQSIEKADMETYRLKDKKVTLHFKNNFKLELKSAKELVMAGLNVNPNNYQNSTPAGYEYPLFEILPSGALTAGVNVKSKFNGK